MSRDYFLISGIIMVVIFYVSIWLIYSIYISREQIKQETLIKQANLINRELTESFHYVNNVINILGKNITEPGNSKLNIIVDILQNPMITSPGLKEQFSWAVFDWDTPDNKMVVSTNRGILKEPRDISYRNYAKMAKKEPWKLHFDSNDIGISSGELVIPAGVGITDSNNKFVGIISLGFKVSKLTRNIDAVINSSNVSYIVIDERSKINMHSADITDEQFKSCITSQLLYNKLTNLSGLISPAIKCNNIVFSNYRRLDNYPFLILTGYNESIDDANFNEILIPGIVGFSVIGFTSLFLLFIVRGIIVKPIIQLSNAAQKIRGATLDCNLQMPDVKTKELRILSKQLMRLLYFVKHIKTQELELKKSKEATEIAHNKVKLLNESLELKVVERTIELEKALTAKTEFLNNMSHEIRTPIQGFTTISSGLVEYWNNFDEQKRLELATQVTNNAKRLSSLIGSLLDLSKFTAGKMMLELQRIDINSAIREIIEECNTLYITDKKLQIIFNNNDSFFIMVDKERLMQVLRNLLTNAIKFSHDNEVIIISVSETEISYDDGNRFKAIKCSVADRGIGIPENELESIFSPFTQSARTKTKAGGTGLGLAICHQIIKAHNGKIWAKNNFDKGTTLNFLLPVTQNHHNNNNVIIVERDIETFTEQITTKEATILIIDDEEACLLSMELLLLGTGYKLVKANSGQAGLDYLKIHYDKIDIVLLDLMMPDIYGLKVLNEIKNNRSLAKIPVILQSGTSDQSEIERAFQMGIVSFISKPYQKQFILNEIAKVLR